MEATNKSSNKIRPVGAALIHEEKREDRRTNGHDEGNRRLTRLCQRAKKACSTGVGNLRYVSHTVVSEEILYINVVENKTHYALHIT
jgi:hypothetical protein